MSYDSITQFINQLENPLFTSLALLIHNDIVFVAFLIALILLEERGEKRKKILLSLALVALLGFGIKELVQVQRPCELLSVKLDSCPESYSFPSLHAALAFTLAIAFLNKPGYWMYLGFALLVAFSRIYLGVHALEDVAAGLVVAAMGYSLTDRLWRWRYGRIPKPEEIPKSTVEGVPKAGPPSTARPSLSIITRLGRLAAVSIFGDADWKWKFGAVRSASEERTSQNTKPTTYNQVTKPTTQNPSPLPHSREYWRQFIHIGIGIVFIALVLTWGRGEVIALSFFGLVVGSLFVNMAFQGKRILFIRWAERVERPEADFAGYGSTWYLLGVLLLATFLSEVNEIAAGIFLLGISDGLSTLAGLHGENKLPYNSGKTVEGSVAFFLSGLATYAWIGPVALPLALVATLAESAVLPWDDNIVVPLVAVVFFLVV